MVSHLTDDQLRKWMDGALSPDDAISVESHIEACSDCAERIGDLSSSSDSFVDRLREMDGDVDSKVGEIRAARDEVDTAAGPDRSFDWNLHFGILALQTSLITRDEFIDACTLWTTNQERGIDELLESQGLLNADDRAMIQGLLGRKLEKARRAGGTGGTRPTTPRAHAHPSDTTTPGATATVILESLGEKRLRLSEVHSTGGIGRVWLARDQVLNRDIALKELLPEHADRESNRARFFREAQITAQLTHPGTVPVYDYVDQDGRHFYTMRFVKGRTLTEVVRDFHDQNVDDENWNVTFIRLLNHFVMVCQTVAYAHSKNVIHRDLKGDNVIIGDFGEVILLDWGLAKRVEETENISTTIVTDGGHVGINTVQGETLGTPAFMAPEQAEGRLDLIDFRTDVYGLAAILYEILSGEPPFTGPHIARVLTNVVEQPPTPPSQMATWVPPGLEAICLRGLEKDRDDRQQSVDELTRLIEEWIFEQAERKRTEQTRERFFGLSPDLLAILDLQGTLREANPAWRQVLGWDASELIGRSLWELVHPDDLGHAQSTFADVSSGMAVDAHEYRCLHKDGQTHWISWNASRLDEERAVYVVGRDVTNLKRAEEKFSGLLESAPDGVVVTDTERRIQIVNRQTERLFGYTRDELIGRPIEVLLPERFRDGHPEKFASYAESPRTRPMASGLELLAQHRDGSEFPVEISLSPMETDEGLLITGTIRDITERRRAAKMFQALLESAPDAMVIVDAGGRIHLVNGQTERVFGYDRSELVGQPIEMLIPDRYREGHPTKFRSFLESPQARPMGTGLSLFGLRKDGTEFPVEISLSPVETADGPLVSSAIRDVSERRRL